MCSIAKINKLKFCECVKYYLDIWTWWYIKIWKWKWPHKHKYECNLIVCICILVILSYPWKKCPFMLETSPETLLYYLQISTYYTTTRSWMRRHLMPVLLWTRTITVWCHKKRLWKVFEKEKKVIYIKKVMAENPVIIENVVFDCKRWVSYVVRHFPPKWLKWGTQSYTYFFNYRSPPKHKKSFFILPWIMEHIS